MDCTICYLITGRPVLSSDRAAVVNVFSVQILRDCINTVCPSVEVVAESYPYAKMQKIESYIYEHDFPREVSKVVVTRPEHGHLEDNDNGHQDNVPYTPPCLIHALQCSSFHCISEWCQDHRYSVIDRIEQVAQSPKILETVLFHGTIVTRTLWGNPSIDNKHGADRTSKR